MCTKYVRGIIFYIWRLGMGVPGQQAFDVEAIEERKEEDKVE